MSNPKGAKKSRIGPQGGPGANPSTSSAPSADSWLVPIIVILLTLVAFLPVLPNEFVNWDDYETLVDNPHYRGLGWTKLGWMFTTFYMGHYQPLSWVTFGLDYLLWEMEPMGYHLTSLLLHVVNALLFYFVALRLLSLARSNPALPKDHLLEVAAGFAALFFALHPLRVESVAWATERRDVLSALFFLWTLLCYLRATTVAGADSVRWRWMIGALIAYALSLLSKASGITLPIVLSLLDVYPLGRLGGGAGKWFGPAARRVWWEKVPFMLLAIMFGIVALLAQKDAGALRPVEQYGFMSRLAQALFGGAFYLWKTVIPVELSPLYELPARLNPLGWPFLLSGAVVLTVSIVLFMARRRWPAGLTTWVYYVVILAPVLGIAQSGVQLVADRYSYLSCLGWALLAGSGVYYVWRLGHAGRTGRTISILGTGLATVAVAVLGVLTWKQTQAWHDSGRLWRHVLAVDQNSALAHNNLANAVFRKGELEEAIQHYRAALQIDPTYAQSHYNLGYVLGNKGELEEAIQHYRRALQLGFSNAEVYYNLGNALSEQGELADAIKHYRQALEIDPTYAAAHENLGLVLASQGQLENAIQHLQKTLELSPGSSETHFHLGAVLAKNGRYGEAIEHLQKAIKIKPEFAEAYHYLGIAMATQGHIGKAIEQFREALRIDPDFAEAHESLGMALAELGKKDEAVKHYEEAVRLMKLRR